VRGVTKRVESTTSGGGLSGGCARPISANADASNQARFDWLMRPSFGYFLATSTREG